MHKHTKTKTTKKTNKHKKFNKTKKGGAIYSFDLDNKIGGLPAFMPLKDTRNSDCPSSHKGGYKKATKQTNTLKRHRTHKKHGSGTLKCNRKHKK